MPSSPVHSVQLLKGSQNTVRSTVLLPGGLQICPWEAQAAQLQPPSSALGTAGDMGSRQPNGMLSARVIGS